MNGYASRSVGPPPLPGAEWDPFFLSFTAPKPGLNVTGGVGVCTAVEIVDPRAHIGLRRHARPNGRPDRLLNPTCIAWHGIGQHELG